MLHCARYNNFIIYYCTFDIHCIENFYNLLKISDSAHCNHMMSY